MRFVSRVASVLFGVAAFGSAYLACAEAVSRQDTPSALARAVQMDRFAPPAHYLERLADLDESAAPAALDAALAANPRLTTARISRGLATERVSRFAGAGRDLAERDLKEAARLDRQYLPAWTLANFYFRRKDQPNFWASARQAAAMEAATSDDYRPLLRLANAMEPRADEVLAHLGDSAALERAELNAVLAGDDAGSVRTVVQALAVRQDSTDRLRLMAVVDRQIHSGRLQDAVDLWNAVAVPQTPLDPSQGRVLTNGDFSRAPQDFGFDWRMPSLAGVASQWTPARRIVFSLSGQQAELCALLEQTLPLARRRLLLRFEYSTTGFDAATGIRWNLGGEDSPALDPAPPGRSASVVFDSAKPGLARLVLLYRRDPGRVRAAGRVEIWNVRAEIP